MQVVQQHERVLEAVRRDPSEKRVAPESFHAVAHKVNDATPGEPVPDEMHPFDIQARDQSLRVHGGLIEDVELQELNDVFYRVKSLWN